MSIVPLSSNGFVAFASEDPVTFDSSWQTVPQRYKGVDPEAIASALSRAGAPKGEFETSSEFEARTAGEKAALFGISGAPRTLVFTGALDGDDVKYNADEQAFFAGGTTPVRLDSLCSLFRNDDAYDEAAWDQTVEWRARRRAGCFVPIKSSRSAEKSYDGVNGFGAKVAVKQLSYMEHLLYLGNSRKFSSTVISPLAIPRGDAPASKRNLRFLVAGRLVDNAQNGSGEYTERSPPTVQRPVDLTFVHDWIELEPDQIWLYNAETGEVYRRYSSFVLPPPEPPAGTPSAAKPKKKRS
jgi:hypothetical protein